MIDTQTLKNDRSAIIFEMLPAARSYARISVQELQASLRDVKGSTPITLTALTIPSYRKTGCPFKDNIQKFARVNGFLNFDYQRSVNNQRRREDKPTDFVSEPRAWGMHLANTPFVTNVTKAGEHKLHLKFKVQKTLSIAYFTLAGQRLTESEVEPFLSEKGQSLRQGVDKVIVERDYTVSNLTTVLWNGMGYYIA